MSVTEEDPRDRQWHGRGSGRGGRLGRRREHGLDVGEVERPLSEYGPNGLRRRDNWRANAVTVGGDHRRIGADTEPPQNGQA